MLQDNVDRDRVVQTLARFPTLARWTAYAHVRSGDPQTAVTILERTRSRSLPRFVPGAGRSLELLSWRSATLEDIGRAATPTCPVAYVLTAFAGSAVLLVRRGDDGHVTVTTYENSLSSGFFVAQMFSLPQPERGFLTAQLISADMGPAIQSLMEPLGSLLEPVVAELLADGIRDLVLIPAGPAAILPWAAATVRGQEDSHTDARRRAAELVGRAVGGRSGPGPGARGRPGQRHRGGAAPRRRRPRTPGRRASAGSSGRGSPDRGGLPRSRRRARRPAARTDAVLEPAADLLDSTPGLSRPERSPSAAGHATAAQRR